MKNGQFEVGDIVTGKKNNSYDVTNERMIEGEITKSFGSLVNVRVNKHVDSKHEGAIFPVLAESLELVSKTLTNPNPIYTFITTTDMKTFVTITHNNEVYASKCDTRFDKFDFRKGLDIAIGRMMKKSKTFNPKIETPKYVQVIRNDLRSGLKIGDIVKVLSYGTCNPTWLYVVCPKQDIFSGDEAYDKEVLKGVNFTYLNDRQYKPVEIYE